MTIVSLRAVPVGLGVLNTADVTPQLWATALSHANACTTTEVGGSRLFRPSAKFFSTSVDLPESSTESRRMRPPLSESTSKPMTEMPLGSVACTFTESFASARSDTVCSIWGAVLSFTAD